MNEIFIYNYICTVSTIPSINQNENSGIEIYRNIKSVLHVILQCNDA